MKARSIISIIAVCLCAFEASACLWDYDTLEMERQRFPNALELVTGKFLRHSPTYYQWRIDNRKKLLEAGSDDPKLYDDLAVAYDKIGEQDKAIEVMLQKEEKHPGLYETYANLGTFYIHSGKLEEGLKYIDRAIEINPDAHFGREIYQRYLVQYVLSKKVDGKLSLPMSKKNTGFRGDRPEFAGFVLAAEAEAKGLSEKEAKQARSKEVAAALKGVLGMMRFGHYDSPVLLEAVGDLLLADWAGDARRLAARAYLKASYEVKDEEAKAAYRKKAETALTMQTVSKNNDRELKLPELEATFQKEISDATSWYAGVLGDEAQWMQVGADLDAEFTKKYYKPAKVTGEEPTVSADSQPDQAPKPLFSVLAPALVAILLVAGIFVMRSRQSRENESKY